MTPPTFLWTKSGRVVVVVHGQRDPSDLEMLTFVNELRATSDWGPAMVVSHGGSPTPGQREYLMQNLTERGVPIAVLTSHPVMRGTANLLHLVRPLLLPFGLNDHTAAARHLGLSVTEAREVLRVRRQFEKRLGIRASVPA